MTTGYSGTPLHKKLGIKEGFLIFVQNPPANYISLLKGIPANVTFLENLKTKADLIHLFTNNFAELSIFLDQFRHQIKKNGSIWVSWYKKAAKLPTELTEDAIRETALALGLVDVKVCAVDEKWSGLKIVIRCEDR